LRGIEDRVVHATIYCISTGTVRQRGSAQKYPPAEHTREIIDADAIFFANQCDLAEKGKKAV